jgi:uncharacterized membrane protein YqaE (UPF0057 family)
MKTFQHIAFAFSLLLLVSSQGLWAVAPGSGHNKDKRGKKMHTEESHSLLGPESPAMMEITAEELIAKTAKTEAEQILKQDRKAVTQSGTKQGSVHAEPAPGGESSEQIESQIKKDAVDKHSGIVGGAVNQLIVMLTTLDRDEMPISDNTVLVLLLLMFFVPPLSVLASTREMKSDFWFSILLTSLFWIPGLVHAAYVVQRES